MKVLKYSLVSLSLIMIHLSVYSKSKGITIDVLYMNESMANKALYHYDKFLLKSDNIYYVAVIKSGTKYKLEIGTNSNNPVKVNPHLTLEQAYTGDFKGHEIPPSFPINLNGIEDRLFIEKLRNRKFNKDIYTFSLETELTNEISIYPNLLDEGSYTEKPNPFISKIRIHNKWIDYDITNWNYPLSHDDQKWQDNIREGIKIEDSRKNKGTLGGFFRLKKYKDTLFGISNWHVIASQKQEGCTIYSSKYLRPIGILFWDQIDELKDVAFFKVDEDLALHLKKKKKIKFWEINDKPLKIKQSVCHTGGNGFNFDNKSQIYSKNASVKIVFGNNKKETFKNQILVHAFSEDGDSGSLVYDFESKKNLKVIGLLVGRTKRSKKIPVDQNSVGQISPNIVHYSVVNNINSIFNKNLKKIFLYKNEKKCRNIKPYLSDLKRFKIKKWK